MKDWIDDRFSPWLGRCVETAGRHPLAIVILALLLASFSLFLVATRLGVNADTEAMLSETLAYRQTEIAFERAFPHFDKDLILVIEAPTPEGARMAAELLVEALGAEPELFENVFAPGTGDFFETYGLLYLDVDELDRLGDELARAQPFLGELSADPSLRGLFGLIERALGEDTLAVGVDLAAVLRRLTHSVDAAAEDRDEPFFFESLLLGEILQEDANRRLIISNPVIDFSEFLPARAAIERVREIVAELRLAETTGARVRITGDLALETDDFRAVSDQATVAGVVSFLLVSLILFAALRSLRLILATVVTLLVGLVLTAAFATLGIGHLNLVSVSFAVLFIGLAVDFGIHLCLRYQELAAAGSGHAAALREAGSAVGGSLVVCAVTTAIGFYAFVPTDYSGVAELGLIAGTGMFISLVCTLTLLPALLSLGRHKAEGPGSVRVSRLRLPRFPERHPKRVVAAAALLALVALATVPRLRFDASPLSVRDPSVESVQALRDLLADSTTSPWGIEVLAPDPEGAQELALRLEALPTVASTRTLLDFVPADQPRKLGVLTEISFFMGFSPEGSERSAPSDSEVRQALRRLRERSDLVAKAHPDPELAAASLELGLALDALGREPDRTGARLERLSAALLPPMTSSIRRLERALSPEPMGLEDIPPSLRDRYQSRDGQLRVQAFPEADLDDSGALEAFVAEVNQVSSETLGGAVRIVESKRHITKALRQALAGAFVAIATLLWLLWRRLPHMLLVMAPLLLAGLFTCAFSVLADVPLNYADVIVLPLLLGIGVDSGIHLVHRWRLGATDLLGTSTARAVLWSALTTAASFGTLALSSHRGMGSLGQLLTAGVAITLVCNLVVLPALLAARGKSGRTRDSAS